MNLENSTVKIVAKTAPWLAPLPSAYFVARSAMTHLAVPLTIAIIIAAIIETLGLASVHTALRAYDWNMHKRQSDPRAPVALTVVLGGVYIVTTWGLVVVLEVWPALSIYAPAIFPALAIIGAVNLAVIAQQELREKVQAADRKERSERQKAARNEPKPSPGNGHGGETTFQNWQDFLAAYPNMLEMTGEEIGTIAGVSGRTGNNWKRYALEQERSGTD